MIRNVLSKRTTTVITRNLDFTKHKINIRRYSSKANDKEDESREQIDQILGEIGSKYKIFKDTESQKITDVYEDKFNYNEVLEDQPEVLDRFRDLNLQRGVNGVFEIEDLVQVLNRENAIDIFVASVPEEIQYVQYMCIVTGKSYRHMKAIAQFVRRVYKHKRSTDDVLPKIEGEESKDWIALDLGNIALHIFSPEARKKYDLDTFWTVGPAFDTLFNMEHPVVEMLEKHSIYLNDLEPAK